MEDLNLHIISEVHFSHYFQGLRLFVTSALKPLHWTPLALISLPHSCSTVTSLDSPSLTLKENLIHPAMFSLALVSLWHSLLNSIHLGFASGPIH